MRFDVVSLVLGSQDPAVISVQKLDIINTALNRVGDKEIESLADTSARAVLCNRVYPTVRDAVLRDAVWRFAIVRIALVELGSTPLFGFDHQFDLPADCIRVLSTDLPDGSPWVVEGGYFLCNEDTVSIQYTARVDDPTVYDALFREALIARLAAEIAWPLTRNGNAQKTFEAVYAQKIVAAKAVASLEGSLRQHYKAELTDVR